MRAPSLYVRLLQCVPPFSIKTMRCEIIAIGTELLLGQVVDTNSSWLAEQLAAHGIDCHFQTRVGDNLARIEEALHAALARSDIIITCGGLGPTQDDITREALARTMRVPLIRDPILLQRIAAVFAERRRPFLDNNARQADVPEGATPMATQPGTAPGLICPLGAQRIYALPGVPWEMRTMFSAEVLSDIQRLAPNPFVIQSHTFYCWGQGESAIAAQLAERFVALEGKHNPTLAFLADERIGIRVRLTAKATDAAHARTLLDDEAHRIRPLLGDTVYAEAQNPDDTPSPEKIVLSLLDAQNKTLAVAESLTGGLIGARLTAIPGASRVFRGALVSYASDIKFQHLHVTPGPVINEATAMQMAQSVRQLLASDIGIAATGVAGPDRQDNQPPGTVCLAVADGERTSACTVYFGNRGRDHVRELSASTLFDMLRRHLQHSSSLS